MKKTIQLLIIPLLCFLQYKSEAQENVRLSGYIKDQETGEDLIGVTIRLKNTNIGAITNMYGFYSLSIPSGQHTLEITYVGYETINKTINTNEGLRFDLEMAPGLERLEEVIVSSEKLNGNVENNEMSVATVKPKTIKQVPAVLGEADVIRSIQLLPGVTAVADGAAGFNVRGGSADQNLVMLDEGIIYNSAHLLGLFSVINPDAIKDVKLYKGGIPARYGGRISSVVDVRQREGNNKEFAGNAGIGLISARAMIEGPLVKEKSSYMVAARRSYGDALLRAMGEKNTAYFYDLNVKTNYNINENNRIFVSGYFGRDKFKLGSIFSNSWGNTTANVRWNHLFSDKLFANFSGIFSNYDYSLDLLTSGAESRWTSNILTLNAKADFGYFISNNHQIDFGADQKWYEFRPGEIDPLKNSNVVANNLDRKYAQELGVYTSYSLNFDKFKMDLGLRYSLFMRTGKQNIPIYENNEPVVYNSALGRYENGTVESQRIYRSGESMTNYYNLAPRLGMTYIFNEQNSVKASYNRTYQYIHLISNSNSPTPLDVWTPSGPFIKPQESDQIALGYFRNFADNMYEASIETYYKNMNNLVDYVDGAELLTNNNIETEILSGKGRAYGMELYLRKNRGKLTGWISYTLAKTERKVTGINNNDPGINFGKYYPANYDKTNDLSITAMYKLGERLMLSSNFIYASGGPTTYPEGRYEYGDLVVPHFGNRNGERLPDYHRLDLSLTLQGKKKRFKNGGHEWVFGIYNVYNRKNASSVYFVEDEANKGDVKAYKSYLFGMMPSVTYNFKF